MGTEARKWQKRGPEAEANSYLGQKVKMPALAGQSSCMPIQYVAPDSQGKTGGDSWREGCS